MDEWKENNARNKIMEYFVPLAQGKVFWYIRTNFCIVNVAFFEDESIFEKDLDWNSADLEEKEDNYRELPGNILSVLCSNKQDWMAQNKNYYW